MTPYRWVDLTAVPAVVMIPDCFGRVNRVALVAKDLRSTEWEIVADDAAKPPKLVRVSLGEAPEGFKTVMPLAVGTTPAGIVVVNGPDHVGMAAFDKASSDTTPRGCG